MIRLTRRYRFASSHRLHAPSLGEAENREVFGKCNNPYGHGHNYIVEVTACGPIEESTGRVVDVARLDALVAAQVVRPFDHRDLNSEVPEFRDLVPTSENLTAVIQTRLNSRWKETFPREAVRLAHVRVFETNRNIIDLPAEETR